MKITNCINKIALLSVTALFFGGCAMSAQQAIPLAQSASAGRIGCAPAEITITNFEGGFQTPARSWTATCKGTSYYCSGTATKGVWRDVSCAK